MTKGIKRRDFLALMGLGGAAATLSCNEDKFTEKWDPWVHPVEGMLPGKPWHYATATRESGPSGLWIKTVGGRAIKADGNPNHPLSEGKINARSQAVLQGLYCPQRVKVPLLDGKEISWEKARSIMDEKLAGTKGKQVSALTGAISGVNRDIWTAFTTSVGKGKHVMFQALSSNALREASELVFGRREIPYVNLKGVDSIVSFGAAFLETWGTPVPQQRDYADFKADFSHRGLHVQLEPKRTMTGANADMWAGIRPGSETLLLRALLSDLYKDSVNLSVEERTLIGVLCSGVNVADAVKRSGLGVKKYETILHQLSHAKHAVVLPAGDLALGKDAVYHHVAMLLLNKCLGAIGTHWNYDSGLSGALQINHQATIDLLTELNQGAVDLLFIKDANPVYALPPSMKAAAAMKKAGFVIAFADVMNETVAQANLVIPSAHELESWGEVQSYGGIQMLMQPVMTPRWELVQAENVLLKHVEANAPGTFSGQDVLSVLKAKWVARIDAESKDPEKAWRSFLKAGGSFVFKEEGETLSVSGNLQTDFFNDYKPTVVSGKALTVVESPRFGDGFTANRDWLQELPDTMTGVVWDSFLEVSRRTAKQEHWSIGDVVKVAAKGVEIEVPVMITDTIADDVFCLETGQGHTHYGDLYKRGVNAFVFFDRKPDDLGDLVVGPMAAKVSPTGRTYRLTTVTLPGKGDRLTQPLSTSDADVSEPIFGGEAYDRDIYQWTSLDELHHGGNAHGHGPDKHDPEYLKSEWPTHKDHNFYEDRAKTAVITGRPDTFYQDYKWELAIDLNRCNGCSACTVACYSENNLNVVGKDQIEKGRIMSWLRINRYITFHKDEEALDTKVHFMPMGCQQCGSAPCETVCPSLATYHNKEGLNAMIYNRCIGTRYCANNCSYKTRRFNWFDAEFDPDLAWQLNPEISIRSRGIMEKCTFCIQRINDAKNTAKNENRKVVDGDLMTACQQVCPANAISFGNATDKKSLIVEKAKDPRGYKALDHHLQTKPGITYLKKVDVSGSKEHA